MASELARYARKAAQIEAYSRIAACLTPKHSRRMNPAILLLGGGKDLPIKASLQRQQEKVPNNTKSSGISL